MFETIEIRKAENGYILVVQSPDEENKELVYDSGRKLMRVLKQYLDPRGKASAEDELPR